MGFSLCLEWGHEGRIHEVPQEDCCSSMYINYYAFCPESTCIHIFMLLPLGLGNLIHNIDWLLFSLVKNKPWHTWVYTWFWHHREQLQLIYFLCYNAWDVFLCCGTQKKEEKYTHSTSSSTTKICSSRGIDTNTLQYTSQDQHIPGECSTGELGRIPFQGRHSWQGALA
jgi:hypothetical protein